MYNSLKDLPNRVLIDTNVLLNAVFVADGAARRSVKHLGQMGYSPFIDEMTELEAIRILNEKKRYFRPGLDLATIFSDFISSACILRLPPAMPLRNTSVKAHDNHVVSAAKHYDAWVLTGDIKLCAQLTADGMQSRLPYDVIIEAALQSGNGPNIDDSFRIVTPTRNRGLIFCRVVPHCGIGTGKGQTFTFCEIENLGRLFYDNQTGELVFSMSIGRSVRLPCPIRDDEPWAICGSYSLPGTGKSGKISVRAGKHPSMTFSKSEPTLKGIHSIRPGSIRFFASVDGQNPMNVHCEAVVIGPQSMNSKNWKAIVATPAGAPNPYDIEVLDRVLEYAGALNPSPQLLHLPTENELKNLNL